MTVCVVDVSEKEEAKLNVQLNNPDMQGDWDLDKLANLSLDFGFELPELGFANSTAQFLFDWDDRFTELFDTPEADAEKGKLAEIKRARADGMERLKEKNNADFYAVVVFADEAERKNFFKRIHVPTTEIYITSEQVYRLAE